MIKSYVAHTDGLKDAATMRAGECRHYSIMVGVATGLKLIGPDPGNYRDWVLEGFFEMTHVATRERTRASRMYNRDRELLQALIKPLLRSRKDDRVWVRVLCREAPRLRRPERTP